MRVLAKYLLLQVPGWVVAALVLTAVYTPIGMSSWQARGLLALLILKDLILYPVVRPAYQTEARHPLANLIGKRGVPVGPLSPSGYIRLRGELWRATATQASASIEPGTHVVVLGGDGLTLLVEPCREPTAVG